MAYAKGTAVAVDRSRADIEKLLDKAGATTRAHLTDAERAVVMFEMRDRRVRFTLPLPSADEFRSPRRKSRLQLEGAREQRVRELWRSLLLTIKAKLESVESGIETFEEAFLAQTVMPDGSTVAEATGEAIALAYREKRMVPLLGHDPKPIALPGPK